MNREYHKWYSPALGREMELLLFGSEGQPVIVFPTSEGRFYDFEDRGMVAALASRIDSGQAQLICVDSVDPESWYNLHVHPLARVRRQLAYELYLVTEVLALAQQRSELAPRTLGCSLGGYQAVNLALRKPHLFAGAMALSGVFDLTVFLDGFYDQECYFNLPTHFLPNLTDPRYLDPIRQGRFILTSGTDDPCLDENRRLDRILTGKGIPHEFHLWPKEMAHDWPAWRQMVAEHFFKTAQ